MGNDRRERLGAGLIAACIMFLLLFLINLTMYAITLNGMVVSLLALISMLYFSGVTLSAMRPARRASIRAPDRPFPPL